MIKSGFTGQSLKKGKVKNAKLHKIDKLTDKIREKSCKKLKMKLKPKKAFSS